MFSFFRSLLAELTAPKPGAKPFRRSTLMDRKRANPPPQSAQQVGFGRRTTQPSRKTTKR